MQRREFIALLGSAAAWPLAARAQQPERVRRVGVLMYLAADDAEAQARLLADMRCIHCMSPLLTHSGHARGDLGRYDA